MANFEVENKILKKEVEKLREENSRLKQKVIAMTEECLDYTQKLPTKVEEYIDKDYKDDPDLKQHFRCGFCFSLWLKTKKETPDNCIIREDGDCYVIEDSREIYVGEKEVLEDYIPFEV